MQTTTTPARPRYHVGPGWAYAAGVWAVLFDLVHVYWYAGGTVARPVIPSAGPVLFTVVTVVLFVVGTVAPFLVPASPARRFGGRMPRTVLTVLLWAGCVLLLGRGLAGIVDELLRVTGVASGGLTGLSLEQVTGYADPPAAVRWTGRGIDAYFALGGVLFGGAARASRQRSARGPITAGPLAAGGV